MSSPLESVPNFLFNYRKSSRQPEGGGGRGGQGAQTKVYPRTFEAFIFVGSMAKKMFSMLCKIVGSNCKKVLRGEVRINLARVNTLTSVWPFFTFMQNLLLPNKNTWASRCTADGDEMTKKYNININK